MTVSSASPSPARKARDVRLRSQFNISADEWDVVAAYQDNLCALCREKYTQSGKNKGKIKALHTDHDHRSGLTRGILCSSCNRRIPSWMTIEWLEDALAYMKYPPVTAALGEERYGRKGKVTNKRPRPRRRTTRKPR